MKRIILQTMPHTGTHTMLYLLRVLGGLPVWWHHWEPPAMQYIGRLLGQDLSDFVFVQTYRDSDNTFESYERRDTERGHEYFRANKGIYDRWAHMFSATTIGIEASRALKTACVMHIYKQMETDVPMDVLRFMNTWEKTASFTNGSAIGSLGYLHEDHWGDVKRALHKYRITNEILDDFFGGENNAT